MAWHLLTCDDIVAFAVLLIKGICRFNCCSRVEDRSIDFGDDARDAYYKDVEAEVWAVIVLLLSYVVASGSCIFFGDVLTDAWKAS